MSLIQIDNRAGSSQMAPILRKLGCEVELTTMAYGDVGFMGYGANGSPASVGIEMKSLADVIACITSGRFAGHQLPGLIQSYDHVWLLIQGEWRPRDRDGVLEYRKQGKNGGTYWSDTSYEAQRTWMWRDVEAWLASMEIMGGIRVHRVPDWDTGAKWIKTIESWFQKEDHHSHLVMYGGKELYSDQALLVKPSLARRIGKELPFIGIKRSADVANHFHTLKQMVDADVNDWRKVDGIGPGIAAKIHKAIHQNGK